MAPKSDNVYIDEVIHILQVSESDFDSLIESHGIKLISDDYGYSISENDFRKLLDFDGLKPLIHRALGTQSIGKLRDESYGLNKRFIKDSSDKLIRYRAYIKTIVSIHSSYNDFIKPIFTETPESAAYILFARSLSVLNMAIDSLEDRHFEAILLLRHIDEAIDLAEYFLIERESETGKKDLTAWFRENISPSNSTCRKSIDKYAASFPGASDLPSMGSLKNRVYQAKSKPVHNAHHSIMETYNVQTTKDGLVGLGFDYGYSSYPRKLNQVISFYQSSIWTLVQGMLICFAGLIKILSQKDIETLNALNLSFDEDRKRRMGE